ncbi:hypothetical protein GCM10009560_54820 [Nonomuraea longicatena]|uniref:Uncharacterized protein n=1 Tax=Nonomuraea longicatena TaxID=83682 RepID=A0ABN1QHE0_9ACTN
MDFPARPSSGPPERAQIRLGLGREPPLREGLREMGRRLRPLRPGDLRRGGTGVFQEVDENDKSYFGAASCAQAADRCRSGEATAQPPCSPHANPPGKIDYIFLSYYWFRNVKGDVAACTPGMSDHHLLRGAASWAN